MKKSLFVLFIVICIMALTTGCKEKEHPYLFPRDTTMYVGDTLHISVVNGYDDFDPRWEHYEDNGVLKLFNTSPSGADVVALKEGTDIVDIGFWVSKVYICQFCSITVLPKEE